MLCVELIKVDSSNAALVREVKPLESRFPCAGARDGRVNGDSAGGRVEVGRWAYRCREEEGDEKVEVDAVLRRLERSDADCCAFRDTT